MSKQLGGGPAFPHMGQEATYDEKVMDGTVVKMKRDKAVAPASGMSLRDYLAGQALVGLGARFWLQHARHAPSDRRRYTAEDAYSMADAMLAERQKEEK